MKLNIQLVVDKNTGKRRWRIELDKKYLGIWRSLPSENAPKVFGRFVDDDPIQLHSACTEICNAAYDVMNNLGKEEKIEEVTVENPVMLNTEV